ncbi:hypothetical protein L218DRAFT_361071 [Marasmius fiardii PR-910]|nr:hypothetical protein L218DRAFT_361071 [Marasmius fiardii PR-910]
MLERQARRSVIEHDAWPGSNEIPQKSTLCLRSSTLQLFDDALIKVQLDHYCHKCGPFYGRRICRPVVENRPLYSQIQYLSVDCFCRLARSGHRGRFESCQSFLCDQSPTTARGSLEKSRLSPIDTRSWFLPRTTALPSNLDTKLLSHRR